MEKISLDALREILTLLLGANKDGQKIIGCSEDFDTWFESWDSEEPIGGTRWQIAAPEVKQ